MMITKWLDMITKWLGMITKLADPQLSRRVADVAELVDHSLFDLPGGV
jgi:hypothetical protein